MPEMFLLATWRLNSINKSEKSASYLMALAVFLGLSYLQRSVWMIPDAVAGGFF
jgi:hypothetical protein